MPLRSAVALSLVVLGSWGVSATGAAAQPLDFAFAHDVEDLGSKMDVRRTYRRLGREALETCEETRGAEDAEACAALLVARVVEGIGNERLTAYHVEESGGEPITTDGSYFFFALEQEEFDTFRGTSDLYERLWDDVEGYCEARDPMAGVGACTKDILARTVGAVDDYGLSRRHDRTTSRQVTVTIIDEN